MATRADAAPAPAATRAEDVATGLLLVVLLVVHGVAVGTHSFDWVPFTDRELARSADWGHTFPVFGAEVTGGPGARVPGWLLLALFGVPQALGGGPEAVHALQIGLYLLGLVVLWVGLRPVFGGWGALGAVGAVASSGAVRDTIRTLWNPGFAPIFACTAAAALARLAAFRDGRALVVLVVAVVLGAQLHLALLGLGLACLPTVVVSLPARPWRAGLVALALVALVSAPWVVVDAAAGWPNARALLVSASNPGPVSRASLVRETGSILAELPSDTWWRVAVVDARLGLAALAAALAGADLASSRARTPGGRAAAALALALVIGLALVVRGARPDVQPRYVAPLIPLVAGLAGAGAARLAGLAGQARPGLRLPVAVGLVALLSAGAALPNGGGYALLRRDLDAIRAATGWSLRDLAGRTVWSKGVPEEEVAFPTSVALASQLAAEGGFPGSLPPPCALVVEGPRAASLVADADPTALVRRLVPGAGPLVGVPTVHRLPSGWQLLLYEVAAGRCPTTTTQCYVTSALEASTRTALADVPCDRVVEVPVPAGRRFLVEPRARWGCTRAHLAVDVDVDATGWSATLTSPELRGACDTPGFGPGVVVAPTLVATRVDGDGPAETRTLALASGVVGDRADATPVQASTAPLPEGTWRLELTLGIPERKEASSTASPGGVDPWRAELSPAWRVGPGPTASPARP